MEKTVIAWTDATFNISWGCTKVSPGCQRCYADPLSQRYQQKVKYWGPHSERRILSDAYWQEPVRWHAKAAKAKTRMRVFSSSMCDVFENHPTITHERHRLWALIRRTPWLDWQLLTKRAERIEENLPPDWGTGYQNVWLGVSIENADYLWRMDTLKQIPAVIHFISFVCRVIVIVRQQFVDTDPHCIPRNGSRTAAHRGANSALV
jgi:protein gp37